VPLKIAELLVNQKVIGLFHGRMEYGPRALGHRSIIGDARSEKMQKILNIKIKFRESFRPFAPSIMEEKVSEYFDFGHASPYMLLVYDVLENKRETISAKDKNKVGIKRLNVVRSVVPAITHVDFSSRIHTVNKHVNAFFYYIIKEFYHKTGCPVIINTSFNVRGEPIVCSPLDAYNCYKNTDMDFLLLDRFLLQKRLEDRKNIDYNWIKNFPLD
jgi:carbamoyltransferase